MLIALAASALMLGDPVVLPDWSDKPGLEQYATAEEYNRALEDPRFTMRRFSYPSDGLMVDAYIYAPVRPGAPLPVIIFNRGSWIREDFAAEMLPMARRLAEAGYLIIAPLYRGSGGTAGRDEMGGAELSDLFNLLPVIAGMEEADESRIFLYGESRGGMMVYQALRDEFPARAAAVYGGFTDLETMLEDPQWKDAAAAIWPDLEQSRREIVYRRSALEWPERIAAPLLIMHGGEDSAVPPQHALSLAQALSRQGHCYELWIAAGDDHVLRRERKQRDRRAADWFDQNAAAPAQTSCSGE